MAVLGKCASTQSHKCSTVACKIVHFDPSLASKNRQDNQDPIFSSVSPAEYNGVMLRVNGTDELLNKPAGGRHRTGKAGAYTALGGILGHFKGWG